MNIRPGHVIGLIWLAWMASWLLAALWSARTLRRPRLSETWPYSVAVLAGTILLWQSAWRVTHEPALWQAGRTGGFVLAGLTLAGLLFAWWARIHLGRLWSGRITRKQDHRVIDTGPYALVRHPIYTGLIFALFATAIAVGTVSALAGAALIAFGLWLKARAEERFLTAELGAEAYGAYRRRVPMLVPRPWT